MLNTGVNLIAPPGACSVRPRSVVVMLARSSGGWFRRIRISGGVGCFGLIAERRARVVHGGLAEKWGMIAAGQRSPLAGQPAQPRQPDPLRPGFWHEAVHCGAHGRRPIPRPAGHREAPTTALRGETIQARLLCKLRIVTPGSIHTIWMASKPTTCLRYLVDRYLPLAGSPAVMGLRQAAEPRPRHRCALSWCPKQ